MGQKLNFNILMIPRFYCDEGAHDLDNIEFVFELEVVDSYSDYSTDNISITINSMYRENDIEVTENAMLVSLSNICLATSMIELLIQYLKVLMKNLAHMQ